VHWACFILYSYVVRYHIYNIKKKILHFDDTVRICARYLPYTPLVVYVNTGRVVCHIMIYWETSWFFFDIDIFRKPMIRYWWESPLLSLIPSQKYSCNKNILTLRFDSATSSGGNGTWHIAFNFLSLSLRQDSQFERFISYLKVVESCCFLFTRYVSYVDLQRNYPTMFIKVNPL
jgi:hypothetical protein